MVLVFENKVVIHVQSDKICVWGSNSCPEKDDGMSDVF